MSKHKHRRQTIEHQVSKHKHRRQTIEHQRQKARRKRRPHTINQEPQNYENRENQ